jgi:hypothetical protein
LDAVLRKTPAAPGRDKAGKLSDPELVLAAVEAYAKAKG